MDRLDVYQTNSKTEALAGKVTCRLEVPSDAIQKQIDASAFYEDPAPFWAPSLAREDYQEFIRPIPMTFATCSRI